MVVTDLLLPLVRRELFADSWAQLDAEAETLSIRAVGSIAFWGPASVMQGQSPLQWMLLPVSTGV